MKPIEIGIIGGSGLYDMPGLMDVQEHQIETPFGRTSDALVTGELEGVPVAFLARHGRGHRLLPSEVSYRANLFALRSLGVRYLLSFSAVGSLREELAPLDFVLPDQFIDLTRKRDSTFFGNGVVAHVSMAQPVCARLGDLVAEAARNVASEDSLRLHRGGAYVCIEGPQFSSLPESLWYQSLGASVIGMTNMPEAKLAREAQMAYCPVAMVTDYDCWHPREAHVTAEAAVANLQRNAARARAVAVRAIALVARHRPDSDAHRALATSMVTPVDAMSPANRHLVEVLSGAL